MLFSDQRGSLALHTLCWLFFGVRGRNSILILGCKKKPWVQYAGSIGWFGIRFDTQVATTQGL